MNDENTDPLSGISLVDAIRLRWALRDIRRKRVSLLPISEQDTATLVTLGLVEMNGDILGLTPKGAGVIS